LRSCQTHRDPDRARAGLDAGKQRNATRIAGGRGDGFRRNRRVLVNHIRYIETFVPPDAAAPCLVLSVAVIHSRGTGRNAWRRTEKCSNAAAPPGRSGARNFRFAFLAGMLRFSRQADRTEWQREERVNRSIDDRGRGHRASRTNAAKSRGPEDQGKRAHMRPGATTASYLPFVPGPRRIM
jgi:hypothetical protein